LIYPEANEPGWSAIIGSVHVRALRFSLAGNLDDAGARLLASLFETASA